MARLLYEKDSTAYCRRAVSRHIRLLRRFPGTSAFVEKIVPLEAGLSQKAAETEEKSLERDSAYDFIVAADFEQDNAVRNVHSEAANYDRDHPTTPVLLTIFPDATFGDIVREPLSRQPDTVDTLAARINSLPADHALRPQAAALQSRSKAVRDAIAHHATAVRDLKIAEAEEEITRSALRRQYESNYYQAREQFGRLVAENLFPDLSARKRDPEDAEESAR